MKDERLKWNERYRRGSYPRAPARIIKRFVDLATPGRALDIAAGAGRNSLYLAERGFFVDAVDISEVGFQIFPESPEEVNKIIADLDHYTLPDAAYDLILNIRYLNRRLFTPISRALKPGGLLIFEAFREDAKHENASENPEYLLKNNELLHAFLSLHIIYYEEYIDEHRKGKHAVASMVAKNPEG